MHSQSTGSVSHLRTRGVREHDLETSWRASVALSVSRLWLLDELVQSVQRCAAAAESRRSRGDVVRANEGFDAAAVGWLGCNRRGTSGYPCNQQIYMATPIHTTLCNGNSVAHQGHTKYVGQF